MLLLIDTLQLGGPARLVVALAIALRARGCPVHVAHLGSGDWQRAVDELRGLRIPVLDLQLRSLADPRPTLRLARHLRRTGVRVVHSHNRYAHLVGRPAAALAGCALVSTDHWIVETDRGLRGAVRCTLDDVTARLFPGERLFVSAAQRREHERLGRLGPPDGPRAHLHAHTVPNGIDVARFRPDPAARVRVRAALGIAPTTPVLVTVAVLRPGKGHGDLLDAMTRLRAGRAAAGAPAVRCLVVGDGSERRALEQHAASLALTDVVRFLGARSDVPALLAAADVYVHPSHFESLPTSILEAMAVGLLVVATAVGGVPELVRHDETGLLVPPGDAGALAAAVEQALAPAGTPARGARLGAAARAWVTQHASMDAWVDRHEAIYRTAVGRVA